MKRLFSLIFCLWPAITFCTPSEIHKGFIVGLSGDTIHGYIIYRTDIELQKKLTFLEDNGKENFYSPGDIISFFIEDKNKLFESVKLSDEGKDTIFFLRCIIKGRISLYVWQREGGNLYYLRKGGRLIELKNTPAEKVIGGLVYNSYKYEYVFALKSDVQNECPDLISMVDDVRFTTEALASFVKKYNSCIGTLEGVRTFSSKSRNLVAKTGITASFSYYPPITNLAHTFYWYGHGYGIGVVEEFSFPGFTDHFLLDLGIRPQWVEFAKSESEYRQKDLLILFPLTVNYELGKGKVKPFLFGVISPTLIHNYKDRWSPFFSFDLNYSAGIGVRYKNYKISTEINRDFYYSLALTYLFRQ
jgi:hypothetical protein